jgi:hypothetical protein
MQTTVYRGVQEALDAAGPAELVSVRSGEGGRILIDVGGARSGISPERLKILRARIELAGGIVRAAAHELHAAIPVAAERTRGGPAPRP